MPFVLHVASALIAHIGDNLGEKILKVFECAVRRRRIITYEFAVAYVEGRGILVGAFSGGVTVHPAQFPDR